jgi:hypothetical protein
MALIAGAGGERDGGGERDQPAVKLIEHRASTS